MTKLYHRDLGLPDEACSAWACKTWRLDYSAHARQAILTDRYGLPRRMPKVIKFSSENVFEVAILNEVVVTKVCVRVGDWQSDFDGPLPDMDLCLVLVPHTDDTLRVKTCWFNERTDVHATLDVSKYSRP